MERAREVVARHYSEDEDWVDENVGRIAKSLQTFLALACMSADRHSMCSEFDSLAEQVGFPRQRVEAFRRREYIFVPEFFDANLIPEVVLHGIASASTEHVSYYDSISNDLDSFDWPSVEEGTRCTVVSYTVNIHLPDGEDAEEYLIEEIRNGNYNQDYSETCSDCESEGETDARWDTSDSREFMRALATLGQEL